MIPQLYLNNKLVKVNYSDASRGLTLFSAWKVNLKLKLDADDMHVSLHDALYPRLDLTFSSAKL